MSAIYLMNKDYYFCFQSLLKSATDCCQTESQIQQRSTMPYENCPQMIERCLGSDARSYFETFSEAQNSFWIKRSTGEDIEQFSAGPINKDVQRNSLFDRSAWRVTEHILSIFLYSKTCLSSLHQVLSCVSNLVPATMVKPYERICMQNRRKNWGLASRLSRSLKVIGTDTDRPAT